MYDIADISGLEHAVNAFCCRKWKLDV